MEDGGYKVRGIRGSPVLTLPPTSFNFNSTQEKTKRERMQGTNQLRKKALCIGINYLGHKGLHPLKGSVNDAHEVEKLLRGGSNKNSDVFIVC